MGSFINNGTGARVYYHGLGAMKAAQKVTGQERRREERAARPTLPQLPLTGKQIHSLRRRGLM